MASPAQTSIPFELSPCSYAEARTLMDALGLAEPVAVTLVRRGYRTVDEARAFLAADECHDPFLFAGMAEVTQRLREATAAGRRITVHGDYDVDGVCATALLVGALRDLGADCDWHIPDRLGDGYGLTEASVELLAGRGTQLLLAVDCGIGAVAEVAAARARALEVIVADHHQPGAQLPDCPILHPLTGGYPCPELCATGVAFKLCEALLGPERAAADLDLVALATVADLVPLRGENRALVRRGLAQLRRQPRPGIRALMAVASVEPSRLDEGDLAFRLGPRINAAGRLYRADAGVELCLTSDLDRATEIASELDRANRERKEAERRVLDAAERARRELPETVRSAPALVVAGEGWHPGVVGIVASRLVERHGVPAVVLSLEGDGRARGSARSIPGFDVLAALEACREHLGRFGGHRAAAGLELDAGRLEAFRAAFASHAVAVLGEVPPVRPERIDAVVDGESLGMDVAEQLERLAPFGIGNPGVRLLVAGARLRDVRPMGEGERHARFRLESGGRSALGVAFGVNGKLAAAERSPSLDVSVRLELNHWNGAVEPRVVLGSVYRTAGEEAEAPPERAPLLDDAEWWRRALAERDAELEPWPPASALSPGRREIVDRRGGSGVAAVAGLAATGEPVLVVSCDALRRRALVEARASPARFGGGLLALASDRVDPASAEAALARLIDRGSGIALADWAALARDPGLAARFLHVVLVDPAPFPHLEDLAAHGEGYLHLAWGDAEVELSLRLHDADWPLRERLAVLYRVLHSREGPASAAGLRGLLAGPGPFPRSPEAVARCLRVLEELGLVAWDRSGAEPALGVVSSKVSDLGRSGAFVAYRARHEEGIRFLNSRRQAR